MATKDTVTLAWGRPTIKAKKAGETEWKTFGAAVEDTTNLEATQGDKMEAKIEGGTNEAVKYKANTYTLTFDERQAPEKETFIEELDGVVQDEYSIIIYPENESAIHAYISRTSVNIQKKFSSTDGFVNTYTFEVLKPTDGSAQVKIGTKAEIEAAAGITGE